MSKSPEHDLQTRCVIWFHYRFPHLKPLFFSVPNGGYRNKAEAARLKAEGANAGVSDLILQLPAGKWSSLNIEMKAGSSQGKNRKYIRHACRHLEDATNYVVPTNSLLIWLPNIYRKLMDGYWNGFVRYILNARRRKSRKYVSNIKKE